MTRDEWINVDDELPELDTAVLIWDPTAVSGDELSVARRTNFNDWKVDGFGWYAGEGATHWRPLPKGPNG